MKKLTRVLLTIASIVFVLGLVLVISGFISGGSIKNVRLIGGKVYDYVDFDKDYSKETIENLELEVSTGKLHIEEGEAFRVVGTDVVENSIEVGVKNNTLYIKENDNSSWGWIHHIGITLFSKESKITVYVPKDFVAKNTELDVEAGGLVIKKLTTDILDLDVEAGKATVDKLTVNDKASIDVEAGSVSGDGYNGKNLEIDVSAGSCNLSGAFYEKLDMDCSAGSINIDTSLGADEYSYDLDQSAGSVRVNGESYKHYDGKNSTAANSIVAKTSAGTIKIETK